MFSINDVYTVAAEAGYRDIIPGIAQAEGNSETAMSAAGGEVSARQTPREISCKCNVWKVTDWQEGRHRGSDEVCTVQQINENSERSPRMRKHGDRGFI